MPKPILSYLYEHESRTPDRVCLTQPVGGGQVVDYTWRQVLGEARRMAAHLRSRGLHPGDRVAILSKNCAHFVIAEIAIWMAGLTTVAIFPTESEATVRYVLEHSEAKLLFVGKLDTWAAQEPGVPEGVARIALPLAPPTDAPSWRSVVEATEPLVGHPSREEHDLAMIIYTSGSTGRPKGVMHCFAAISRFAETLTSMYTMTPDDRALSYLPLAHVYERALLAGCWMVVGFRLYFAESLDTFVADLRRAQPTIFASVPRLWLKFQQGVFSRMNPRRLDLLLSIPVVNRIVARRIREGLGLGSVRLAASASAPIPADLIQWYRRIGLMLLEGYGMTEDFGFSHASTVEKNRPGYVGVPYPGVEVRLSPEGEVLVKSPCRMVGYYKDPELTAEVFTEDGFFRTGDRGERDPDGLLRITGRVKELFKTAKGKYVAPAPIENRLNEHPLVELSCVSGVGQPAAFGFVQLAEDLRPKVGDPAVRARVEAELAALLTRVNADLPGYEHLQMLVVAREPWTIENGLLTPTMKLKRANLEAAFGPHLDGWYGRKEPVIWA